MYPDLVPFVLVHAACFAVIRTGAGYVDWVICLALYGVRMFAITGFKHRYFAHRTYKTGRITQFLMALLSQTSAQRGVVWWAAKHREHHQYSDTALDVHSPRQHGFWFAHMGWIFSPKRGEADFSRVPDLTRYPELMWLDKYMLLPAFVLATAVCIGAGWSGLVVGFFFSTVMTYHGTFAINSLAHQFGRQRYVTGDDSRNSLLLALVTLGEGWHNNHHWYQGSTRQGFRWWEIDVTYYLLRLLAVTGLIWDLKVPPLPVVRGERRLSHKLLEKVATQLAGNYCVERISNQIRETWSHAPSLDDVRERCRQAWSHGQSAVAQAHLPALPTLEELKKRAQDIFPQTPVLDQIVERARQMLARDVCDRLFERPLATP